MTSTTIRTRFTTWRTTPKFNKELKRHQTLLTNWIAETGDKGQATESDDSLLQAYYRWREKCVNPEYDRVRDLAEPKPAPVAKEKKRKKTKK